MDRIIRQLLRNSILTGILLAVGAGLLLPGYSEAQESPQAYFDRANDRLQNQDYEGALELYRTILEMDRVSGPLFLNMGISYIEIDSLGMGKYYLMKAERFTETREAASEGLEYLETQFSRQSAVLPKLPWERFFDWLGTVMTAGTLLGMGIILLNLGVLIYAATWFIAIREKQLRLTGIGTAAMALLVVLSSFYLQYQQSRYSRAVMIHRQASVLERPAEDASLVSQAYEGYAFTVDHYRSSEREGWAYIRMNNGLYGWIPEEEILVL